MLAISRLPWLSLHVNNFSKNISFFDAFIPRPFISQSHVPNKPACLIRFKNFKLFLIFIASFLRFDYSRAQSSWDLISLRKSLVFHHRFLRPIHYRLRLTSDSIRTGGSDMQILLLEFRPIRFNKETRTLASCWIIINNGLGKLIKTDM